MWFMSALDPDALYGEDVYAAVIDEGTRCKEASWYAVRSTLTATEGPIRIIGNVKGRKNWVYRMARKAEAGAPNMHYAKLTAYDAIEAGVLSEEEVEDARAMLPDHVFKELYMAEPSADEGNPFGADAIEDCARDGGSVILPVVWGWDLAKSKDWTVGIGIDSSGDVTDIQRFQLPWGETEKLIRRKCDGTMTVIDSTGVGDPIVERLMLDGLQIEGYKFTGQTKQQLMEGLAAAIQGREITFPRGSVLYHELMAFEYKIKIRDGHVTNIAYSAPEGMHDDCVVALGLAVMLWKRYKVTGQWWCGEVTAGAESEGGIWIPPDYIG
jgi:hypothetical protein